MICPKCKKPLRHSHKYMIDIRIEDYNYNHRVEYEKGILEEECKEIIQLFFQELRKRQK